MTRRSLRASTALAIAVGALAAAGPAAAVGPGVDGVLAFTTFRSPDTKSSVYRVTVTGSDLQRLTVPSSNDDSGPTWSPDGTRIAFSSSRSAPGVNPDTNPEIWVMNADGSDPTALTNTPSPATNTSPAWSPDGTRIAFVRTDAGGTPDIWVMDAGGANAFELTPDDAFIYDHPDWSPDGRQIVLDSDRDGDPEIYAMAVTLGAPLRQLTSNDGRVDDDPSWSPDGRRIVFRGNTGEPSILMMNADGSGQTDFAGNLGAEELAPTWSPEGTRIAFTEKSPAGERLSVVTTTGTVALTPVFAFGTPPAATPAWQPLRPVPAVSSVDPSTVTAGGGAFTLTVTGTGFTPGTVVRWNGADRPTTVVSTTRVTAAIPASDITAAGVARVSVSAPAPGGGTTGEFVVNVAAGTAPPPPGRDLTITRGTAVGTWRANRLRGSLRLNGVLGRRAALRVTVRTARGKLVLRRTTTVPAGSYRLVVPLPARTLPGVLRVALDEPRPPAGRARIATVTRVVRLRPPPQGVTERAFITTSPQGAARSRVQRNVRVLYGVFRFAALPRKGRRFTVTWRIDGFRVTFPATRPAGRTLVAQIGSIGGGVLRPGRWTATLRSGGVVVTTARVRVG